MEKTTTIFCMNRIAQGMYNMSGSTACNFCVYQQPGFRRR